MTLSAHASLLSCEGIKERGIMNDQPISGNQPETPLQNNVCVRFYEQAWNSRLQAIKDICKESGENDPYILMKNFLRKTNGMTLKVDDATQKIEYVKNINVINEGEALYPTGKPLFRRETVLEEMCRVPFYSDPTELISDYLEQFPVETLVELGAGNGFNLLKIFYEGMYRGEIFGGEFTDSGVDTINYLGSLNPRMKLKGFKFDHKAPDLSILGKRDRVLLFSMHSIEQVFKVTPLYFKALAQVADEVRGVHIEPFGFQFNIGDNASGPVSQVQAEHFKRMYWNHDFVASLIAARDAGWIEIEFIAKNVMYGDYGNPSSVAIWKSTPKTANA